MRIQTLLLLLPIAFVPLAELQKPAPKPAEKPAETPADKPPSATPVTIVPAQFLAPLDEIAKQLAKGGREKETKDLLTALDKLGYPKPNLDKLEKSTKDDLAHAKKAIDSLPTGAKQLRTTAKQLVALMDKVEDPEAKQAFARNILLIDGNCVEAHKALGHEKIGRTWVASELKDLRKRRGETLKAIGDAKKLDVPMEIGEIDDPLIQRACGVKATLITRGYLELHTNFSVEKSTRLMRETCRALALGSWLRGKGLTLISDAKPKPGQSHQVWVLIDSREQYKKLQADLNAEGKLDADDSKLVNDPKVELGAYSLPSGENIALAQWEASTQAALLVANAGMAENIHTSLSAGYLNWLALTCFGCTLPNYVFKEEFRKRDETHIETEDEKREREELLRLAKAGIAGSRTWMQFLAEHGEDPPWRDSFVMALGAVSGNDVHKATSVFEFLSEANLFSPLYAALRPKENGNPVLQYNEALEKASKALQKKVRDEKKKAEAANKKKEGEEESEEEPADEVPLANGSDSMYLTTVGEVETKWRAWLLGSRPGVAERIDKENLKAWPPEALSVLEYMNDIRDNSYKGSEKKTDVKITGLWKLKFDPELSEQCGLHAHYLTLHPEQQKWPDAHEEYADKEGYTVEGAWAGTHSVIVWGTLADHKEGIDVWMGSFYHRLPLLDPGVLRLGWGAEDIYQVMDMGSLAAPYDKPYVVLYPYDGQKDVPVGFLGNELPNPVPDPNDPKLDVNEAEIYGYPVTIQTNPIDEKKVLIDIDMKLFEGKDGKTEVECFYSTPSKPTNPESAPAGAWCLIPKHKLKDKMDYKVVANWNTGGRGTDTSIGKHVEWTFKTK
jgi:hypothetical protein